MTDFLLSLLTGERLPAAADIIGKSTILLFLTSIVCWLLRGRSAALRHRIWTFALAGCLAVPVVAVMGPQLRIPVLPEQAVLPSATVSIASVTDTGDQGQAICQPTDSEPAELSSGSDVVASTEFNGAAVACDAGTGTGTQVDVDQRLVSTVGESVRDVDLTWSEMLWAIWLLGFLLMTGRLAAAIWLQRRRLGRMTTIDDADWTSMASAIASQLGVRRSFSTLQSSATSVPMTCGIFRSVVIVPADWSTWSEEHSRCVLSHELAHIRRCDVAIQMFARMVAAVYWFNPMVWFAVYRLRVEREFACDDAVLLSGRRPTEYANALLTTLRSSRQPRPDLGVAMVDSARLDRRVESILDRKQPRVPPGRRAGLLLTLFTVCCVLLIGTATLTTIASNAQDTDFSFGTASGTAVELSQTITIQGVVTGPDGQPVQNAEVFVPGGTHTRTVRRNRVRTDSRGRYRMVCEDNGAAVITVAVDGDEHFYLPAVQTLKHVEGTGEVTADFELQRGVIVRGKVVEAGTNRPIASEHRDFCDDVQPGPLLSGIATYYPLEDNGWLSDLGQGLDSIPFEYSQTNHRRSVYIDANGEFQMSVPPGSGIVLIEAVPPRGQPRLYGLPEVPYLTIAGGITKGTSPIDKLEEVNFAGIIKPIEADGFHAYSLIAPAGDSNQVDLRFEVNRAPSHSIRFVDPDDNPVGQLHVTGLLPAFDFGHVRSTAETRVEGSEAVAVGIPPGRQRRIIAVSSDGRLGVAGGVDGTSELPVTFRMQPTASLTFRVIDAATGSPCVGYQFRMAYSNDSTGGLEMRVKPRDMFITDEQGEVTIDAVIPGEPLTLSVNAIQVRNPAGKGRKRLRVNLPPELTHLTMKPGENRHIGEVSVELVDARQPAVSEQQ